jgi:hypothetical protein
MPLDQIPGSATSNTVAELENGRLRVTYGFHILIELIHLDRLQSGEMACESIFQDFRKGVMATI